MTRRLLVDVRPLRESPPFRRLWIGSGLSGIGSQMTVFAVAFQVFTLTHSSFAVGAVGLATALPAIALGLFGGSVADAVDRRRLCIAMTSVQALISVAFAAQAFADLGQVWLLVRPRRTVVHRRFDQRAGAANVPRPAATAGAGGLRRGAQHADHARGPHDRTGSRRHHRR